MHHLGLLLDTSHHHKQASMHVAFVYKDMHKDISKIQQVLRKPSSRACDSNHDMSLHMCSLCVRKKQRPPHRVGPQLRQECFHMPATIGVCLIQ